MKKLLLIVITFCIYIVGQHTYVNAENFTIDTFDSDITIQDDGSLDIIEEIFVNFSESSHGIFRQIPQRHHADLGYFAYDFTIRSIENIIFNYTKPEPIRERTPEGGKFDLSYSSPHLNITSVNIPYTTYSQDNDFFIKIGDPQTLVDGEQKYSINYTVSPGVMDYDGQKELYRNIIGSRPVSIGKVKFNLTIPSALSGHHFDSGDIFIYVGPKGSREIVPFSRSGNSIHGLVDTIAVGDQITIGIKFPKGTFSGLIAPIYYESMPGTSSPISMGDNTKTGLILVVPIIVIIFLIIQWIRKRRNTRRKRGSDPLVVQYYPPAGLTPIEGGYIDNDQFDPREIVALLYDRAVRGYIRIHETEKQGIVRSTSYISFVTVREPSHFNELEQALRQIIFKDKEEFSFDRKTKVFFDHIEESVQAYSEGKYYQRGGFRDGMESNPTGIALYRHLMGYKDFLAHVEQAKLKVMLASDPLYIEKCLPRAIIFGTETQLTKAAEGLAIDPPTRYYGRNYIMYNMINNSIASGQSSYTHAVQTSSSGFSSGGGGGFSGGGGGGGGGGSW